MAGVKRAEYRAKPCRYRGPVLIHAGKSESDIGALDQYIAELPRYANPVLYFGCLLGVVTLTDCRLIRPGEFALIFADPRPIEPVQSKGKLAMLYDTDIDDLAAKFPDLAWLLDVR